MAEQMDLTTAIDVCRPETGDLDSPELEAVREALRNDPRLARQFEAIGRFDARLREVLLAGDVPVGLEDRLLAALATDEATSLSNRAVSPLRRGRRRWWTALAAAAAVAAIATGVTVWSIWMQEDQLTLSAIHEQAADWCAVLVEDRWRTSPAPQEFLPSSELLMTPTAWQRIDLPEVEGSAVAYRLPEPPGVRRMTLLVLKANVSGVLRFPTPQPYKTQDRLVAAWQVGGNTFVLVIQGDELGVLQDVYEQAVKLHHPVI